MSTVTEAWSVLLNSVFNWASLTAMFSTFDDSVLRHTGLYLLSSTLRKWQKLLCSTIDRGKLQSIIKWDSIALVKAVCCGILPHTTVQKLRDWRLPLFICDVFILLVFFISVRGKHIKQMAGISYIHTWIALITHYWYHLTLCSYTFCVLCTVQIFRQIDRLINLINGCFGNIVLHPNKAIWSWEFLLVISW